MSVRVGGLVPLTTVDFPDHLAAVVFCQGCAWRCPYCHNPHLLNVRTRGDTGWMETLKFLASRQGLLDGVVFSGGEPLLQAGLAAAMADVWNMGFKVGLHTAGPKPARLAQVLPLVDWIGFDVKAPFADYERVTGVAGSGRLAWKSLELMAGSGVSFQLRTTLDKRLLTDRDLARLKRDLDALGFADGLVVQKCRTVPASGFMA
ncbi:MAG: anaerobic ribonucleoside-triphosphate reductase activating protein [Rhodospirillales bacterium]|nr:anaerobic ribonucleoside-triphosphate reductase activating protein [Rhodospirillales bacterium]